ncbi:hypothetical protein M513_03486 [Trichuris suis]|uniref:Uncharacterized protein n=1 Tax=Trichuris suis TaxID=68888 RepID=A0A085MEU2_9BILA|nr:hypothetical protein M513_03486 [Trichuris suis]
MFDATLSQKLRAPSVREYWQEIRIGEPESICAVLVDISRRRQGETLARTHKQLLRISLHICSVEVRTTA